MAAIDRPTGPNAARFDLKRTTSEAQQATVQVGETMLAKVAERLGYSLEALLIANQQIQDPNNLKAGQDIRLPQAPETMEVPAAALEMPPAAGSSEPRFEDPLAKALAQLFLRHGGHALPAFRQNNGTPDAHNPAQGGPGNVLSWKKDGPRGNSNVAKAKPGSGISVHSKLGVNGDGSEVTIKRQVGSPQGYDTKWQAMAVTRLGKAEPAVVVNVGGKWHALETSKAIDGKFKSADATRTTHGVPSSRDLTAAQQLVKSLQTRLTELNGMKQTTAVQDETGEVLKKLAAANLRRASLVLGVPESDIKFQNNNSSRQPGVINIVPSQDVNGPSGSHGPAAGQGADPEFSKDLKSVFDVKSPTLDNPAWAQLTLFHEVEHENHWQMAQEWVKLYEADTKRPFMKQGLHLFKKWIEDQAKAKPPKISKADADLMVDVAGGFDGMTEARANIRQALLAYQVGEPDLAAKAISSYAWALAPKSQGGGGKYGAPHSQSEFMKGLYEEIRTAYRQMPKDLQKKFETAIADAKAKYPSAWISDFKLK